MAAPDAPPLARVKSDPVRNPHLALEGFLPNRNPHVGSLLHAPSSANASSHYFRSNVRSQADYRKAKSFRNNPYTGTFHQAPGVWKPEAFVYRKHLRPQGDTGGPPRLRRSVSMPRWGSDGKPVIAASTAPACTSTTPHTAASTTGTPSGTLAVSPTPIARTKRHWWSSPPSPAARSDAEDDGYSTSSDSDQEDVECGMPGYSGPAGDTGGSYSHSTKSGVVTVGMGTPKLQPPSVARVMRGTAFSAGDAKACGAASFGDAAKEADRYRKLTIATNNSEGTATADNSACTTPATPSDTFTPISSLPSVLTFGRGFGASDPVALLTPLGGAPVWGAVRHLLSPSHPEDEDDWLAAPPSPAPATSPVVRSPPSRFAFHLGVQWHQGYVLDDKYDVDKSVGSGNFAVVKLCRERATKRKLAVKVISKRNLFTEDERKSVRREIEVHSTMHHPNIIELVDVLESPDAIQLVVERAPGRDLQTLINSRASPQFSETVTRVLFEQLFEALDYIHNTRRVIHCDIKPENILFGKALLGANDEDDDAPFLGLFDVVKVCDFGNARRSRDARYYSQTRDVSLVPFSSVTGTMGYIAPEILERKNYGTAVDMWALGVLMFQMLGGYRPFMPYTSCLTKSVDFPDIKWATISPEAKDLCRRLLEVNPARRITARQAQDHPWLSMKFSKVPPPSPVVPVSKLH